MSKLGGEGAANALLEEAEAKNGGLVTARSERSRQMSDSQSPMSGELEHIVKPDGSRYLSSDFWSRLSGEVGHYMFRAWLISRFVFILVLPVFIDFAHLNSLSQSFSVEDVICWKCENF